MQTTSPSTDISSSTPKAEKLSILELFARTFMTQMGQVRDVSRRRRPHLTREDKSSSSSRRYNRTPKSERVRLHRASGLDSQAVLDAAISLRLRGDLVGAEDLLTRALQEHANKRLFKELNRVDRLLLKQRKENFGDQDQRVL